MDRLKWDESYDRIGIQSDHFIRFVFFVVIEIARMWRFLLSAVASQKLDRR